MNIQTSDFINIYVLPDDAKCNLSDKHPTDIDECPSCKFDYFGEICIPELCEHYTEG